MRNCVLEEIRVYNRSAHVFAEHRESNMTALVRVGIFYDVKVHTI